MKNQSVTILLTVRNNAETIKECIEALLNQNYKDYGVYVTDAFSDDGTHDILRKYADRIRLEQIKGNMAVAYNHMIKNVKTDFVAFIDGDAIADKNWLKNLIGSFEDGVVAVGGKPRTPSTKNKLQEMIGKELEYRFDQMPKYVERLPTMNLCVRTSVAKQTKFDERLDVTQETEWAYQLTKLGKIVYESKAVVWHYHRATWEGYFKQQYRYALFIRTALEKHAEKKKGDEITTPLMVAQIPLMYFTFLFLLLSFFKIFSILLALSAGVLVLLYVYNAVLIAKSIQDFAVLVAMFFVRNVAWCAGIVRGMFK